MTHAGRKLALAVVFAILSVGCDARTMQQPPAAPQANILGTPVWQVEPHWTNFMSSGCDLHVRPSPVYEARISLPTRYQMIISFHGQMEASVKDLSDLCEYAYIDSADKALSYVRVRTSRTAAGTWPGMGRALPWMGWEVFEGGKVGPYAGQIPPGIMAKGNWKPAAVRQDGEYWKITRFVLLPDPKIVFGYRNMVRITERVRDDGEYEVEEQVVAYEGPLQGIHTMLPPVGEL